MRTRIWSLISALALMLLAVAPAQLAAAQPRSGGILTVALDGEIDTIDPTKSVTIVGFQVYTQMYEGLVAANPTLDGVEPRLAESWDVSPDGLTYTFHLRQGVKFHNGKDFKAEDVKYTFDKIMDPDFGSPRRPNFTTIDHMVVLDDYTVAFVLSHPYAPMLTQLETMYLQPSGTDNDFSKTPFKDNPNLRRAIAWSVDRQTIADQLLYGLGKPAQIPVPETNWAYTTELNNPAGYDLAKAKAFYDQANPKPSTVTVKVSPTYPDEVKMAELMQQSLAQIGLNLNIQQLEWSTWIKDVVSNSDYEMEIVLISGGIDPDDFYYQWLHTGEVFNIVKYSDPVMDKMMLDARSTLDQDLRKGMYTQIANKMLDDVPWSHIIYRQSVIAGNSALKDFVMTGRYDMNFRSVWLDR